MRLLRIVMTSGKFYWKKIAKRLNEMVRNSKKVFEMLPHTMTRKGQNL